MNRFLIFSILLLACCFSFQVGLAQSEAEAAGHELQIKHSSGKGRTRVVHPKDKVTVYAGDRSSYTGYYLDADSQSIRIDSLRFSLREIQAIKVPGRRELQASRTWVTLLIVFLVSIPIGWITGIVGFLLAFGALAYVVGTVLAVAGSLLWIIGMIGTIVALAALIFTAINGRQLNARSGWGIRPGKVCPAPGAKRHR